MPTFFGFNTLRKAPKRSLSRVLNYVNKLRLPTEPPMTENFTYLSRNGMEAQTGFEPVSTSFADWRVSRFTTGPF